MKISELPKEIREKALMYQKRDGDDLETDNLLYAFCWSDTKEGNDYWNNLDDQEPPKEDLYMKFNKEYPTDTIVESVINQFKRRSNVGIEKYGVTMDRTDLSTLQWMVHFREELMDGLLYLERVIQDKQNEK